MILRFISVIKRLANSRLIILSITGYSMNQDMRSNITAIMQSSHTIFLWNGPWHRCCISFQWRIQDFPQGGGAPTPKIAIIFHIFAENCMKMKEFGPPGGGARPWRPPWNPPMVLYPLNAVLHVNISMIICSLFSDGSWTPRGSISQRLLGSHKWKSRQIQLIFWNV